MRDRRMRALMALNGALIIVLALITFGPGSVSAQSRTPRAHGQYGIVGGVIQGQTTAAIYVLDASNEEMVALLWDWSRRQYKAVGYRDLRRDQQGARGRGR